MINTNLPPILHRFQIVADYWSNFRYRHASVGDPRGEGVIPTNIWINFTSPETRGIVLPDAVNRMIISSFIWSLDTIPDPDGQTDGQNSSSYDSALHYEQCGRAVKMHSTLTVPCSSGGRQSASSLVYRPQSLLLKIVPVLKLSIAKVSLSCIVYQINIAVS